MPPQFRLDFSLEPGLDYQRCMRTIDIYFIQSCDKNDYDSQSLALTFFIRSSPAHFSAQIPHLVYLIGSLIFLMLFRFCWLLGGFVAFSITLIQILLNRLVALLDHARIAACWAILCLVGGIE